MCVLGGRVLASVPAHPRTARTAWLCMGPGAFWSSDEGQDPAQAELKGSVRRVRCRCLCLRLLGRWPISVHSPCANSARGTAQMSLLPVKREVSSEPHQYVFDIRSLQVMDSFQPESTPTLALQKKEFV